MPLIKKPLHAKEKKQFRIRLDEDLYNEIHSYCKWADLPSIDYFFEQISLMALKKDKEWRDLKKINEVLLTKNSEQA